MKRSHLKTSMPEASQPHYRSTDISGKKSSERKEMEGITSITSVISQAVLPKIRGPNRNGRFWAEAEEDCHGRARRGLAMTVFWNQ